MKRQETRRPLPRNTTYCCRYLYYELFFPTPPVRALQNGARVIYVRPTPKSISSSAPAPKTPSIPVRCMVKVRTLCCRRERSTATKRLIRGNKNTLGQAHPRPQHKSQPPKGERAASKDGGRGYTQANPMTPHRRGRRRVVYICQAADVVGERERDRDPLPAAPPPKTNVPTGQKAVGSTRLGRP